MTVTSLPSVNADDEWSPLKAVIVGRAGKACFPYAPPAMIAATMPAEHIGSFKPQNPFPPSIIAKAEEELDTLASILEHEGIKVYRPADNVDWLSKKGYTGAMPRDGLMSVSNTLIEACFAWPSRAHEIEVGFTEILDQLGVDPRVKIVRRPESSFANTLLDGQTENAKWAINNSRPAFDAADFMRFGSTIIGQYSHVTNQAGVDHIRQNLPTGYQLEMLDVKDDSAMHIDATLLPLREGLMVYHPYKVTEESLRRHSVLAGWDLRPYPYVPEARSSPPLYMTSPWLCLNALVLDGQKVVVEASDDKTAKWFSSLGMTCLPCPFQHVNSIGGSFHCATVDLVRLGKGPH